MAEVQEGKPLAVEMHGAGIHLKPVRNRGVTYLPPKTHLGNAIPNSSIVELVRAVEKYLASLVADAKNLPTHT